MIMKQARHPRAGMDAHTELYYDPSGSMLRSRPAQGVDCRCTGSCERAGAFLE